MSHDLIHQHAPDDDDGITLDDSRDAFESNPNASTANAYLLNARTYWHDGIISDGTYESIKEQVQGYLGDEDDEPVPDTSPWMICPECSGEGKHSKHLGAITQEDRERDWDPDSFQDYLDGAYDITCDCCRGAGKVRTKAYEAWAEKQADYRSERHHGDHSRFGL